MRNNEMRKTHAGEFITILENRVPTMIAVSQITGISIWPNTDENGYNIEIDYNGGRALIPRKTLRGARELVLDLVARFNLDMFYMLGTIEDAD